MTEWVEPVDAYVHLRPAMLLDGMGAHPEARYAYVATDFAYEARLQGDELTIRRGEETETRRGAPLALIQTLADEMYTPCDEPEGFTGGLVGYFGYEFTQAIEPTLRLHAADTPDALLWLAESVVVFDRVERRWWVHSRRGETRRQEIAAAVTAAPANDADVTGDWQTSLDQPAFEAAVAHMQEHIRAGDLYQANIATRFTIEAEADPVALYRRLSHANPSPFMALLEADDHAVVSCSPEQLLAVRDGRIRTRPIAGTRPRGDGREDERLEQELVQDDKERAEHTMLVDLLRNDIAKVSVPGSVHVPELMSVERYSHVMHLVSRVEGDVRPGSRFTDWLAALFPGGTITGAPKHRACMRIQEAEPVARGPYTGSAGFLSWSHNAHWNIMIRTMVLKDGELRVQAGSGIVADSDPAREWIEAGNKARALLEAATGGAPATRDRLGSVSPHAAWSHPTADPVEARVLLIDNYDSFVHNIADYCAALGAACQVIRNDEDWETAMQDFAPSHLILGPGPGRPEDSGATLAILEAGIELPILGVCLGHQAMAHASGVPVAVGQPVHGKTARIASATGLLEGMAPLHVTRYHSLYVPQAPPDWSVDARLDDGTIMAMHHERRPWVGLQFHPESICTDQGLEMLRRFLA